jgi:hypothetical protein
MQWIHKSEMAKPDVKGEGHCKDTTVDGGGHLKSHQWIILEMMLLTKVQICKGNCRLVSLRVGMSKSGRGSEVSLLINRHRY